MTGLAACFLWGLLSQVFTFYAVFDETAFQCLKSSDISSGVFLSIGEVRGGEGSFRGGGFSVISPA